MKLKGKLLDKDIKAFVSNSQAYINSLITLIPTLDIAKLKDNNSSNKRYNKGRDYTNPKVAL
jgi:hypothetical protein